MKRWASLVLSALLLFSLAACGGKDRFECKISEGEKKKNA